MTYEAYRWPAAAPESSSDHAGEDVAVYAIGPQSHLFRFDVFVWFQFVMTSCVSGEFISKTTSPTFLPMPPVLERG